MPRFTNSSQEDRNHSSELLRSFIYLSYYYGGVGPCFNIAFDIGFVFATVFSCAVQYKMSCATNEALQAEYMSSILTIVD